MVLQCAARSRVTSASTSSMGASFTHVVNTLLESNLEAMLEYSGMLARQAVPGPAMMTLSMPRRLHARRTHSRYSQHAGNAILKSASLAPPPGFEGHADFTEELDAGRRPGLPPPGFAGDCLHS